MGEIINNTHRRAVRSACALGVMALALAGSSYGQGTRYTYDFDGQINPTDPTEGIDHSAGRINSVSTSFDSGTNELSYYANLGPAPGTGALANGFWLVMSPGPNPKGHPGELAIFYLDGSQANNLRLTVYGYNGVNGDTSFRDGNGLVGGDQAPDRIASSLLNQAFVNNLTMRTEADGSRTLGFNVDATSINEHVPQYPGPGGVGEWTGAQFGERIGIWFHPVAGLNTAYQNGYLQSWSYARGGWLDVNNRNAVPEPGTLLALGAGLGILARRRRAKKA